MHFCFLFGIALLGAVLLQGEIPTAQAAQPARQTLARAKPSGMPESTAKPAASAGRPAVKASSTDSEPAYPPTLKNISWSGKQARASVLIELSRKTPYRCEYMPPDPANNIPPRIHITLPKLVSAPGVKASILPKGVPVTRIRTALSDRETQVMLDCGEIGAYAATMRKSSLRIEVSRRKDIPGGVAVSGRGAGEKEKTPVKPAGSLMEQLGLTVRTIMLDAGHGGRDPGTMANRIVERQFTLKMAKIVGSLLRKKGFTVLYTRAGDKYLSLEGRTVAANAKKADLFISLHANAHSDTLVQGLEVYYLDMAKTSGAATVAARENAVAAKNISDLQFILTDLMLSAKLEESHELAVCIQKGILAQLAKNKYAYHDNGVRSAPFYVLTGARMPAVLVEFGYVTNKDDAAKLSSDRFLQQQAAGLVNGIITYKTKLARFAPGKKQR